MKYICVTHVDSRTGIRCNVAPMRNGPAFPAVKGFKYEWNDQSNWPMTHPDHFPRFYGTCDDDADFSIEGVILVFEDTESQTAKEQYDLAYNAEMKARLPKTASPMRIRLALLEMNLLDSVQTYVESLEEPAKSKVYILWEYSSEINKYHPAIQKLAEQMNIDENTLDEIFVRANELSEDPFVESE